MGDRAVFLFFVFLFLMFPLREDAAAVVLPVKAVLLRELDGALVALAFFEVGGQRRDAVYLPQLRGYLVELGGVFVGGDGEGGREIIEALLLRQRGGFFETQAVAGKAALAALGDVFQTLYRVVKLIRVVVTNDKRDWVLGGELGDQMLLLRDAPLELLGGVDVGIVVKDGYLKILREIFQSIGGAGGAAAVKQQAGDSPLCLKALDLTIQQQLIVYLLHYSFSFLLPMPSSTMAASISAMPVSLRMPALSPKNTMPMTAPTIGSTATSMAALPDSIPERPLV